MKLVAIDICKSFGNKEVLDRLSFQLDSNEIYGLFGRNGSGKSTFLKILFGMLRADSGQFFLNQQHYDPYKSFADQKIGYLPQNNMFPASIKVRDLIPMVVPESKVQDTVFYTPGIPELAAQTVGSLSEGQKTLLGVILSCNLPHPILLLDEPFSMTDPLTIERIKDQILQTSQNKSVIITDHYYTDVLDIATRSGLINKGKLVNVSGKSDLQKLGYTR